MIYFPPVFITLKLRKQLITSPLRYIKLLSSSKVPSFTRLLSEKNPAASIKSDVTPVTQPIMAIIIVRFIYKSTNILSANALALAETPSDFSISPGSLAVSIMEKEAGSAKLLFIFMAPIIC